MVGNPVLWIDQEHNMIVNASHYEPLKYACQSSPPTPSRQMKVAFPDEKLDKEKWPEIKQWLDWVKAQRNLGGEDPPFPNTYNYDRMLRKFVSNPVEPVGELFCILWHYESVTLSVRQYFLKQNQIIREYPWLKTQGATQ
jgi:hypothetical protein